MSFPSVLLKRLLVSEFRQTIRRSFLKVDLIFFRTVFEFCKVPTALTNKTLCLKTVEKVDSRLNLLQLPDLTDGLIKIFLNTAKNALHKKFFKSWLTLTKKRRTHLWPKALLNCYSAKHSHQCISSKGIGLHSD